MAIFVYECCTDGLLMGGIQALRPFYVPRGFSWCGGCWDERSMLLGFETTNPPVLAPVSTGVGGGGGCFMKIPVHRGS